MRKPRLPSEAVRLAAQERLTAVALAGQQAGFVQLRSIAQQVRADALDNKAVGKGNVAVLLYRSLFGRYCHVIDATSRARGTAPLPQPRSSGGFFQPSIDPVSGRVMDTDAEYKSISELARVLSLEDAERSAGVVYLFTELEPCRSCAGVFQQFREAFPFIVLVVKFDHPYPFRRGTNELGTP